MYLNFEIAKSLSSCKVTLDYTKKFMDFYNRMNYHYEIEKKVSSRYDKSVYLIGSTISSLKSFLLEDNIYKNGIFIVQHAIRTQQLKNLYRDDGYFSRFGSFFIALGTLSNYEMLDNVIWDMYNYLLTLGIQNSQILIRISSNDGDLTSSCLKVLPFIKTEINSKQNNYYKHSYGMDIYGISGRNMNIALKNYLTKDYEDIGNIVVIEKHNNPVAVELAFGLSTIISSVYGCNHTIQATPIADFFECINYDRCRFADCISVVMHLAFEGVYPNSTKMAGRLMKKYIQGIVFYRKKFGISLSNVMNIFNNYFNEYYKFKYNVNSSFVIDKVEKYLIMMEGK